MTQLKFNLIKLFFSVLFLMPSFLQAHSIPSFPTVIFPPPIHYHPSPTYYPPPITCFCETYSGTCSLVTYALQPFSTCARGSLCQCSYSSRDYFGNIYNFYENGVIL